MILVADSGSTKTIWKCTDGTGKVKTVHTAGINPYYNKADEVAKEVSGARAQLSAMNIEEIYFYGAGCSTDRQKGIVSEALAKQFGSEVIYDSRKIQALYASWGQDRDLVFMMVKIF
jgi:hypothetical protein